MKPRLVFRALRDQGLKPEGVFLRVIYTSDYLKVLDADNRGLAHGGAVVSRSWETFRRHQPKVAARMRVIWQSRWRPLPPVVEAEGVGGELAEAFQGLLLNMAEDPQGCQADLRPQNRMLTLR